MKSIQRKETSFVLDVSVANNTHPTLYKTLCTTVYELGYLEPLSKRGLADWGVIPRQKKFISKNKSEFASESGGLMRRPFCRPEV